MKIRLVVVLTVLVKKQTQKKERKKGKRRACQCLRLFHCASAGVCVHVYAAFPLERLFSASSDQIHKKRGCKKHRDDGLGIYGLKKRKADEKETEKKKKTKT